MWKKQMRAILYWIRLWLVASGDRKVKEYCGQIQELWKCGEVSSWSLFEFYQEDPEECQQGQHYNNQSLRGRERKRQFGWLQKKETVGLNRSAWSPGKQVDRVCLSVPSMQAGCQKWHQGYELHWKMGCYCDPHIVKKGDQFQEQSLPEESMLWRHLTLFWTTQTFTSEMQDSMVRARVNASEGESDLYSSVSSANMWRKTEWRLITSERGWVYTMKRVGPRTEPWGTPQATREGEDFTVFIVTTCVLSRRTCHCL